MRAAGVLAARTELLEGVLVDIPRPSARKQEIIDRLAAALAQHLDAEIAPRPPIHPDAYAVFDPTIMVHDWYELPLTEAYRLHRFSIAEYHQMADLGLVGVARNELLDGVVFETAQRRRHDHYADRVAAVLRQISDLTLRAWDVVQLGPYSLLRLDVALYRPRDDRRSRSAVGHDILLAIDFDDTPEVVQSVRWPVYARWGIEHAWLIDVRNAEIHTAQDPAGSAYATAHTRRSGESLGLPTFGDLVAVAALTGP
jgi:hypothetical protein